MSTSHLSPTSPLHQMAAVLRMMGLSRREKRWSAAAGMYTYLRLHHNGQGSENYRRLSVLLRHFKPGLTLQTMYPTVLPLDEYEVFKCAANRRLR